MWDRNHHLSILLQWCPMGLFRAVKEQRAGTLRDQLNRLSMGSNSSPWGKGVWECYLIQATEDENRCKYSDWAQFSASNGFCKNGNIDSCWNITKLQIQPLHDSLGSISWLSYNQAHSWISICSHFSWMIPRHMYLPCYLQGEICDILNRLLSM